MIHSNLSIICQLWRMTTLGVFRWAWGRCEMKHAILLVTSHVNFYSGNRHSYISMSSAVDLGYSRIPLSEKVKCKYIRLLVNSDTPTRRIRLIGVLRRFQHLRSHIMAAETGVPGRHRRPSASNWRTSQHTYI